MEVHIRNFGTVRSADVHIGGLTVITGENDTGKSTIGKILFSLVKAIARYNEDLEEAKEIRITDLAEGIYFDFRRIVNISEHQEVRDNFHPRRLYNAIKKDPEAAIANLESILERYKINEISASLYERCKERIAKILEITNEPEDENAAINRAIRKSFFSEFNGEIIQKNIMPQPKAAISISDGASDLIEISWAKDTIYDFKYSDDLGYADATYVDSPAIMQFHQFARMSKALFDNGPKMRMTVPLHIKDLAAKLSDSIYEFSASDLFSILGSEKNVVNISDKIHSLFDGEVSYNSDNLDFVLERNGYQISSSNIASGIKSLGMLDLLIKSGSVRKNTLLILDEPEVNLHPKWQIEYSEIICELVSNNVDIIVSTHSPYIIEALSHFSEKLEIENRFYLARKDGQLSKFEDITKKIDIAIDALAAPLEKINKEMFDDF